MKKIFQSSIFNFQSGQTLIETMVALFILTMGVSSAIGLALYAFSTSNAVTRQIIATGIAREGIEAVKNMRDTNWLADSLSVNGCYDFATGTANAANCYSHWLNQTFCIDPTNNAGSNCSGNVTTMGYAIGLSPSFGQTGDLWNIYRQDNGNSDYGMTFNATNSNGAGFYTQDGNTVCSLSGTNSYCRKIIITRNSGSSPYNKDVGGLLTVQSRVWWADKKCPAVNDWDETAVPAKIPSPACRVELDTYLTNWKNYQLP